MLCRIAKLELFQINSQHEIALVGHGITTGPAWHSPAGPFLLGFHPKPRPTFVKFTCARPLLIINKLHPLNCAGGTNLCSPATLQKVNHLIINELSKRAVAGEFHGAQERHCTRKGAFAGLTMSQLMLTRCVRRTVCGSGQLSILGLRPKPRRCAKLSRMSTLLSLRGRLMAEEGPRSKRGKVTGRGGPLMRTSSGKVAGKAFPVR